MTPFSDILDRAAARNGGVEAVEAQLSKPKDEAALRAMSDDRYLSRMCLRAFRAGLKHSLVDARWPAFEDVFHGFDPYRIRAMPDEALEALMSERRIIRHWGKIKAVRDNAAALIAVSEARGGFGVYIAAWPGDDVMGLWRDLGRRFSQMGGNSAAYFLRMVGRDTFLLTGDVITALVEAGVIDKKPTTKDARAAVAGAFNAWAAESGRPLCQISKILALTTA